MFAQSTIIAAVRFVIWDGCTGSSAANSCGDGIVLFLAASGGESKTSEEEEDSNELIPSEFIPMGPEG
jgi:hypothetical protein